MFYFFLRHTGYWGDNWTLFYRDDRLNAKQARVVIRALDGQIDQYVHKIKAISAAKMAKVKRLQIDEQWAARQDRWLPRHNWIKPESDHKRILLGHAHDMAKRMADNFAADNQPKATPASGDESPADDDAGGFDTLPDRYKIPVTQYRAAIARLHEQGNTKPKTHEAYKVADQIEKGAGDGGLILNFGTWSRYVREGLKLLGEGKLPARAHRADSKNIVNRSDI